MGRKKAIAFLLMMTALTQAGLVLYTPAFLQISEALNISSQLMKTTLSSYLFGFAIAQIIYGPISDRYGRKWVLFVSTGIFSVGCLGSAFAGTYGELLYTRAIQGLGIGSCMTLSRAVLRDLFVGHDYIRLASYLSSGFAIGLGISPIIGGYLSSILPWQSTFIFLFLFGVSFMFCIWRYLPETAKEKDKTPLTKFTHSVIRNCYRSLRDKKFISYLFGGVFAYGTLIAYTTMAPFLLQKGLSFSSSDFGWITFFIACIYYFSTSINRKFLLQFGPHKMMGIGMALIVLSGLLMLIFYSAGFFNVYVIVFPIAFAILGQGLIWSNCVASALKDLSHIAGTAAAFFSFLQMLVSSILSLLIAIPTEKTQFPLSLVIIFLGVLSWLSLRKNLSIPPPA